MATTQELLDEVRRRVEERRQNGQYPPGLEEQLDAEFKEILGVVHRGSGELEGIQRVLEDLHRQIDDLELVPSTRSRTPLGRLAHMVSVRLFGRAVRDTRQTVRTSLVLASEALEMMRRQLIHQQGQDARILNQIEKAVMDRLLMVDVLVEAVLELEKKSGQDSTRAR